MDALDKYRKMNLNQFQMEEIRLGFAHGLNIEQVELYAKHQFDNLQMKEIRLGFEAGLSDGQVRSYADPQIDADAMNHMRLVIDRDGKVTENRHADLRHKHLKNILFAVLIIAGGIAAVFAGFLLTGNLNEYMQPLELTLTSEKVDVEYGSSFNSMEYVKSFTQDGTAELILPDPIDTNVLGDKVLLYKLKNSKKVITKELDVHVIDSKAPKLILKQNEVKLTRTVDDFHASEYIEEASDNVDGNLKDKVTETELDTSKDEQVITYSVSDSSGNAATADLKVTLVDPVITSPAPSATAPSGNSTSTNSNSADPAQGNTTVPSQNKVPSGTRTGETKYYWFTDGYDIDSAYNACKVDGSAYGSYSCEPMMVNGLYTGYKLTYK